MQQQQKVQLVQSIESDFVPGFLQLPLSRDKGTPGQENFFVQGNGTTGCPVPIVWVCFTTDLCNESKKKIGKSVTPFSFF